MGSKAGATLGDLHADLARAQKALARRQKATIPRDVEAPDVNAGPQELFWWRLVVETRGLRDEALAAMAHGPCAAHQKLLISCAESYHNARQARLEVEARRAGASDDVEGLVADLSALPTEQLRGIVHALSAVLADRG